MSSESHPQYAAAETELATSDADVSRPLPVKNKTGGINRWLLYLIALAGCVLLLLVLPAPYPLFMLIGLVGLALVIAARDSGFTVAGVTSGAGRLLRSFRSLSASALELDQAEASRRQHWSQRFALAAVGFMILAAIGFRPAADTGLQLPFIWMLV